MSALPNNDLEIKLAFLERHIEEQDKVILGLSNEMAALKRALARLTENFDQSQDGPASAAPEDERPPHY